MLEARFLGQFEVLKSALEVSSAEGRAMSQQEAIEFALRWTE